MPTFSFVRKEVRTVEYKLQVVADYYAQAEVYASVGPIKYVLAKEHVTQIGDPVVTEEVTVATALLPAAETRRTSCDEPNEANVGKTRPKRQELPLSNGQVLFVQEGQGRLSIGVADEDGDVYLCCVEDSGVYVYGNSGDASGRLTAGLSG